MHYGVASAMTATSASPLGPARRAVRALTGSRARWRVAAAAASARLTGAGRREVARAATGLGDELAFVARSTGDPRLSSPPDPSLGSHLTSVAPSVTKLPPFLSHLPDHLRPQAPSRSKSSVSTCSGFSHGSDTATCNPLVFSFCRFSVPPQLGRRAVQGISMVMNLLLEYKL